MLSACSESAGDIFILLGSKRFKKTIAFRSGLEFKRQWFISLKVQANR